MRENELAKERVERERVCAGTDSEHEHGGWTVDRVARADLATARLQEIADDGVDARIWRAQNREDAADRHVDIDV